MRLPVGCGDMDASALRTVVRHVHNPAARHWKAVRKIIAYLKAT
ncbi:unnamed protein product, partial [Ascophyllum nodosum]